MVKLLKNTKAYFWAGFLLAQFVMFFVFSKIDFLVSLNEHFFEFQKYVHQSLFSNFTFSVGDLLYVLLGFLLIYFIVKKYWKKSLITLNIIYFTYQIFWGMLYFQEPLINKLSKEKITLEETKILTLKYLETCKKDRQLVHEDKNGVFKVFDLSKLKTDVLISQKNIPPEFSTKKTTNINTIKPSLFKGIMSFTGILGYYNPFTAEAQYNAELPSSSLPFTLAHETSHQIGFAREQEASFIGYLVGKNSQNLDLKYSTDYFVLKSLLNSLIEKNPEFVKSVLENYSEGMKRDRLYEKAFQKKHEGFLDTIFLNLNNFFLKTNQQEGSITYSYFVDLLIKYERKK